MGVIPTPNSMSMFTSTLSHRATPFKSHHRFSVAIKTVDKREVPDLLWLILFSTHTIKMDMQSSITFSSMMCVMSSAYCCKSRRH